MSKSYKSYTDENGRVDFFDGQAPLHTTDVVIRLQDLSDENDALRRRIKNMRDKLIKFAEKELSDEFN